MSIWFRPIEDFKLFEQLDLGKEGAGTLMQTLGIQVTAVGEDYLEASMEVTPALHNPLGILHGGANVVLAETVASYAANMAIDFTQFFCVGQEINANHLRSVRSGIVRAIAKPIHLGRTTSVWEVKIYDEQDKLTCISRMTAAIVARTR